MEILKYSRLPAPAVCKDHPKLLSILQWPNNVPNSCAGPAFAFAKSELIAKVQLQSQHLPISTVQVKLLPLLRKTWCRR